MEFREWIQHDFETTRFRVQLLWFIHDTIWSNNGVNKIPEGMQEHVLCKLYWNLLYKCNAKLYTHSYSWT